MFLTQLILNPGSRSVLEDINDSYKLHQRVMRGFPTPLPKGERVLYRLDYQNNPIRLVMLVQSHSPSNWVDLERTGYLMQPAHSKSFAPSFYNGQLLRFRLVANPTKRIHDRKDQENGRRVGLLGEEDQLKWLVRKGEANGFSVLLAQANKIGQMAGWKSEKEERHNIRQQGVRFDGRLQVTEAEVFIKALENGIGAGKGFGFGLLSLAPVD